MFKGKGCHFTVKENSPTGHFIGSVIATDADEGVNGRLSYSVAPGSSVPFAVNPETGAISVAGRGVDYESSKQHRFTIHATDQAVAPDSPRTTAIDCLVVVLDRNDNAPEFPTKVIKLSVPEDIVVRSVLAFVQARDADTGTGGDVHYQLGVVSGAGGGGGGENDITVDNQIAVEWKNGNNHQTQPSGTSTTAKGSLGHAAKSMPFAVDAESGALSVVQPLDFETVSSYNLSIVALDRGQPVLSATLWGK